MMMMMDELP